MKQEDKELLLKDLCGRLPYRVRMKEINPAFYNNEWNTEYTDDTPYYLYSVTSEGTCCIESDKGGVCCCSVEGFKPYLFPLASMTIEKRNEFYEMTQPHILASFDEGKLIAEENEYRPITPTMMYPNMIEIDWMYKHHFDIFGLIEKGLAIDCTNLNIY